MFGPFGHCTTKKQDITGYSYIQVVQNLIFTGPGQVSEQILELID